ncbi:MAG TPA: hypothetical protein VGS96_00750 [Thermoanaerobaculia bacterium]|jgi:hypothetical protein|nr:hypothetical protein [Thermoanaerobaculia bacterium]
MRFRLAFVFLLLLTSCGKLNELPTGPGGGGSPVDPNATFSRVKSEVFTPTCSAVGCHGTIAPQESLILTADRAYALIVNVRSTENPALNRVAPGDASNSYLYRKITGVGITGDRMPLGGPFLSDAQIALVRDWIRRGAPND